MVAPASRWTRQPCPPWPGMRSLPGRARAGRRLHHAGSIGARRAAIRNSRLPSGPVIGLGSIPSTPAGSAASHCGIVSQTSHVLPDPGPLPCCRPGLPDLELRLDQRHRQAPGAQRVKGAGSRVRRPMKLASQTSAPEARRASRPQVRALVLSSPPRAGRCVASRQAGRVRHRPHRRAPHRSQQQSVKPPVEAPISRQTRASGDRPK